MDAFLQLWAERSPREKSVLLAGCAIIIASIVYLVTIEPAVTGITRLERGLPQTRAQAAKLDALLAEVKSLRGRAQVATLSPQETRAAVEKTLAGAGLKAARVVPLSDGDLQLTFANVPYAAWAMWLASVERELGGRATSVTATTTGTPGNVDVELAIRLARK
ncbi:MAG TPA: type II secretion system protein M [Burkholderiaceae bacterium]|nr:type II secretion system protein M [Burkholderiaceae bacterium]